MHVIVRLSITLNHCKGNHYAHAILRVTITHTSLQGCYTLLGREGVNLKMCFVFINETFSLKPFGKCENEISHSTSIIQSLLHCTLL